MPDTKPITQEALEKLDALHHRRASLHSSRLASRDEAMQFFNAYPALRALIREQAEQINVLEHNARNDGRCQLQHAQRIAELEALRKPGNVVCISKERISELERCEERVAELEAAVHDLRKEYDSLDAEDGGWNDQQAQGIAELEADA